LAIQGHAYCLHNAGRKNNHPGFNFSKDLTFHLIALSGEQWMTDKIKKKKTSSFVPIIIQPTILV
jgi:hypothetical protein